MGVVLRVVAFVEAVVAVGAMFGASNPADWIARTALLTGGALPAAMAWLIVACAAKHRLQRLPRAGQWSVGVGFGALAGCMAVAW